MTLGLDAEIEEENRNRKTRCYKMMLEAGADVSLHTCLGSIWVNSFIDAVCTTSSVNTTQLSEVYYALILRRQQ